jgi:hypothetical protein
VKPYTKKECASLRRQWRAEFGARNPEHLDEKRPPGDPAYLDSVVIVGPRGYCDIYDDGTVETFGVLQDLFD